MADFDDEMYDEDEFADESGTPQQIEPQVSEASQEPPQQETNQVDDDITADVLRLKGISDPNKIKFEDTSGAIIERSWDSLTRDEQIKILGDVRESNAPQQSDADQLESDEIDLINAIRNSGMDVKQYMNTITPVQQEVNSSQLDNMSDEDVYALDILQKVGSDNISDEELDAALEAAKSNETLFKKTVEGLRAEYARKEQEQVQMQQNEQAYAQQQRYNAFANVVGNEINNFSSFGGQELRLSNDEKDELYNYMLNLDQNGVSDLGKQLQNPQTLTEVAFWLLNGHKVMEEMQQQTRDAYTRGYNAGKGNFGNNTLKSKLVWKKPQTQSKKDFNWDSEDWD